MTIIIGGHNLGLQDSSTTILNRNDPTGNGTLGHGEQPYVNVSNGDLVVRQRDAFMPSLGADFELVRTYNSRGYLTGIAQNWLLSTGVTLSFHQDKPLNNGPAVTNYSAIYGDGSEAHFVFDTSRKLYVSTDGAGAYETLKLLGTADADGAKYVLTRADQTQFRFDKDFMLLSNVDTNGVRMDYLYQGGKLQQVRDDTGHVITFNYSGLGTLSSITDETGVALVIYGYTQGNLTSVTDRYGHITRYTYDSQNSLLSKITLPNQQTVNGVVETYAAREMSFTYQSINWDDHPHSGTPFDQGFAYVIKSVTDALGGVTSFDYDFTFNANAPDLSDRDHPFKVLGGRYFAGGTTRVVDALGNARATSNDDAEFVAWRTANGFYATYNAAVIAASPTLTLQYNTIRNAQSVAYTYDADGYITKVVDQRGLETTYTYDAKDNLTSIVDRNGFGAANSEDPYFRALRKDLGYVDAAGNGKLAGSLTAAEKTAILAKFTTTFAYDENGNLVSRTDNAGNVTRWTYTSFNKIASETSAMGNAPGNTADLKALYTTTYTYDAKQKLIQQTDPGGDITRFEYDAFGNLTKRTVFLDPTDLITPAKQQVTQFFYDTFGNNNETVDAEGVHTFRTFDHFGNVTKSIDGLSGVTDYTYDADNRLLTTRDPEGHDTVNTYDAVGNRISMKDANGHTVTQVFDKNNLLITTIDPSATPALSRITTFKYDILGNGTEVTDAQGRKTTYTFDARRQLVRVDTPQVLKVLNGSETLGAYHTTYAYDGESNLVTRTDNNGNVTQILYTSNGLLKRSTDPTGNVTEYLYDANLQQVQITIGAQLDPALRRVLKLGYDEENQPIAETDALNHVTRTAYDAPGNVVAITDANDHTINFEYDRNNRLLTETRPEVTDPMSGLPVPYTVEHQYDKNGNEIETTDENGHHTKFNFDKDNRQVRVIDANDITTVFRYDSRHNITQIAIGVQAHLDTSDKVVIDDVSEAQVTSFAYDEFNQLVDRTDGVGNALLASDAPLYQQLRVERGLPALVASLTTEQKDQIRNAFTERFAYDRVGNLTRETDHAGRVQLSEYDALNRLQKRTDAFDLPDARSTAFRYDGNGNIVKSVDALQRKTLFKYDGANRLTDTTEPLGNVTRTEYDSFGNRIAETRGFGGPQARITRFEYDLNNRLQRQLDPKGHATAYEYDPVGNRLKVIDGGLGETRFEYDALDRNIKVIDPMNFEARFEYDGVGNRVRIIDARGGIQRLEYDFANRYIQTTDAEGRVTRLEYDVLGNVVTQTKALGTDEEQTTEFVYDAEGNLRQVTDAEGNVSSRGYDDVYNYIRTRDGNGHETRYGFDALNRQVSITDPEGGVRTIAYDAVDNRVSETNENGHATLTSDSAYYRGVRFALGIKNAVGTDGKLVVDLTAAEKNVIRARFTTTFGFDLNNQLTVQTDGLGIETSYAYDQVGNQVTITRAANTAAASTTTFTYDEDDQLVKQTDAFGNALATSDAQLYRAERVALHFAAAVADLTDDDKAALRALHTVTNEYDANHNITKVIDARGNATLYRYDKDNRVDQITDPLGNLTTFVYDGNGNRVRVTDARDNPATTYYNKDNEVVLTVDREGGAISFDYDAAGNLRTRTVHITKLGAVDLDVKPDIAPHPDDQITTFKYDGLNRLKVQTDGEGYCTEYTYDAVGNRLSTRQQIDTAGTTFAETHDYFDGLDRVVVSVSAERYLTTFEYDATGNQTAQTVFDQKVVVPAGGVAPQPVAGDAGRRTASTFDVLGRKVTEMSPLEALTRFEYDAKGNLVVQIDSAGTPDARRTGFVYDAVDRQTDVTRNLNEDGTVTSATDTTHFVHDANGNVLERHDAFGTSEVAVLRYDYDANNRITRETGPLGEATSFEYDPVGNMAVRTDPNGNALAESDDAYYQDLRTGLGYAASVSGLSEDDKKALRALYTTSFEYDRNNRLTEQVDPSGTQTQHEYDAAGNQVRTTIAAASALAASALSASSASATKTSTYEYDRDNRLIAELDPVGNALLSDTDGNSDYYILLREQLGIVYDSSSPLAGQGKRVEDLTDADRQQIRDAYSTLYRYDGADKRTEIIQPGGRHTVQQYDLDGRPDRIVDPEGGVTLFEYDSAGNAIKITDATGQVRTNTYDKHGRLLTTTYGGITTTNTYDKRGNVTSTTEAFADGRTTGGVLTGKPTAMFTVAGDARTSFYQYDLANRQTRVTDQEGFSTTFTYDNAGNVKKMVRGEYLTPATDPTYDADKAARAKPQTVTFTYDQSGRLVRTTTGENAFTRFDYDADGNKIKKIDGATDGSIAARETKFDYDVSDRLTRSTPPGGGVTEYVYDGVGNLQMERQLQSGTGASDPDAVWIERTYEYDNFGRVTAELAPVGVTGSADPRDAMQTVRTEFEYDAMGNRTTLIRAAGTADERREQMFYNANNALIAQVDAMGNRTTYIVDATGNRIAETDALNRTTRFYYSGGRLLGSLDNDGYLTLFAQDASGAAIETRRFMRRLAEVLPNQNPDTFNAADQANLSALSRSDDRVVVTQYDRVGNATSLRALDFSAATTRYLNHTEYSYDSNGLKLTETAFADPNGTDVNAAGNRKLRYEYDTAGRLIKFTDRDDTLTEYQYDAVNNRTRETVTPAAGYGSAVVRSSAMVYDLDNRVVARIDADGFALTTSDDAHYRDLRKSLGVVYGASSPNAGEGKLVADLTATEKQTLLDSRTAHLTFDKAGNVLTMTDARARVTTFTYDLTNRVRTTTIDAGAASGRLNLKTESYYDRVGNRIQFVDARGNTTDFEYDENNRLTKTIQPQVSTYTVSGGDEQLHPTSQTVYDAVGNVVQTIDPNGNKSTLYYDGNDQLVAELSADRVLKTYTYNADGDQTSETVYMTRLDAAAHDPAVPPPVPGGEKRTIAREYDALGRLTVETFPLADVSQLVVNAAGPSVTTTQTAPQQRYEYNVFDELTRTIDRNGNSVRAWYDAKGRRVAIVDAAGYLTKYKFDAFDDTIQQQAYATPLTSIALDSHGLPVPVANDAVFSVDRVFDAADRVVEETAPESRITTVNSGTPDLSQFVTGSERVKATFVYDAAGNEVQRTRAAGTTQATTEYSYYDGANRRVASIDGARVLHQFGFDGNGSSTLLKRYINPVKAAVDLATLDLSALTSTTDVNTLNGGLGLLQGGSSASEDESTTLTYDAVDRLQKLEQPLAGTTRSQNYKYDAAGAVTFKEDWHTAAEGGIYVDQSVLDELGRPIKRISADGNGSLAEYDALGNVISVFTGALTASQAVAATGVGASIGDNLNLFWTIPGASATSRVVWDTVSHASDNTTNPDITYTRDTAEQATNIVANGGATLDLATLGSAQTVYFRVLSKDSAGNLAWTGEFSVSIPPRLSSVTVERTKTNVEFEAQFTGTLQGSPVLSYGSTSASNLDQQATFTFNSTTQRWHVSIATPSTQDFFYRISWQDTALATYSSRVVTVETVSEHDGLVANLSSASETTNGVTKYEISIDAELGNADASQYKTLSVEWRRSGSGSGFDVMTTTGKAADAGSTVFKLKIGKGKTLAAGTYEVVISGNTQDGRRVVLGSFASLDTGAIPSGAQTRVSWPAPEAPAGTTAGQLVLIDGARLADAQVDRREGQLLVDPGTVGTTPVDYDVFYGRLVPQSHTLGVSFNQAQHTVASRDHYVTDVDDNIIATVWNLFWLNDAFTTGVSLTLDDAEIANVDTDGVHVAYRIAGPGTAFTNDETLTQSGNIFSRNLPLTAGQTYDLKVYYLDVDGREVIVEWRRVSVPVPPGPSFAGQVQTAGKDNPPAVQTRSLPVGIPQSFSGMSLTVLASETAGTLTGHSNGTVTVQPGVYIGPYGTQAALAPLTLNPVEVAGSSPGSRLTNGQETGYYTETLYSALNAKVASNSGDGVWRVFDVDANGNAVATHLLGDPSIPNDSLTLPQLRPTLDQLRSAITAAGDITTYTEYDARNRTVTEYGELVSGLVLNNGSTAAAAARAITRRRYDYADRLIEEVQEGIAGDAARFRDYSYDGTGNLFEQRAGSLTAAQAKTVLTSKRAYYDRLGNTVAEADGNDHATVREFDYQQGGRLTAERDAVNDKTEYTLDGFGRVTTVTRPAHDGLTSSTARAVTGMTYDQADRMTQVTDSLGFDTLYVYDARDRRTAEVNANADALVSQDNQFRDIRKQLGYKDSSGEGKLASQLTQAEKNEIRQRYTTEFSYDKLGRLTDTVTRQGGVAIHERRSYDAYGNLTGETDDINLFTVSKLGGISGSTVEAELGSALGLPSGAQFLVEISGATQSYFNGTFSAQASGTSSFTFSIPGNANPGTADGTITARIKLTRSKSYGGFGRLAAETDEGGRTTDLKYDRYGRVAKESNSSSGKNIDKIYDEEGRIVLVDDKATKTSTTYTYDVWGDVKKEVLRITTDSTNRAATQKFAANNVTARSVNYDYDAVGRMIHWNDTVTNKGLHYEYDAAGNQHRVYSDELDSAGQPAVNHYYTYDSADRVTGLWQGVPNAAGSTQERKYEYDAAGNRTDATIDAVVHTLKYEGEARVVRDTWTDPDGSHTALWTYDAVGNVVKYSEQTGTDATKVTSNSFYENNRNYFTDDDGQQTTRQLDFAGRSLHTTIVNDDDTQEFDAVYSLDGRELSVKGSGPHDSKGNTTELYDANDNLVRLNLGEGNDFDNAEFKTFVLNNDGQIIFRFHETGRKDPADSSTEFLYANRTPVGETDVSAGTTVLDDKGYNLVQDIGGDHPSSAVTFYTALGGETLQQVALAVYGNPSLWYVLAGANGLRGDERLAAGARITVPNTVQVGSLTADSHVLYEPSEIIGSTLPNLKNPPKNNCALIGAIIGIILLAIVGAIVTALTAGAAGPAVAAAVAGAVTAVGASAAVAFVAGVVAAVLVTAVIGAAVGFAVGAITQGIKIAAGLQQGFDWKDVAAEVIAGAFSGIASGIGSAISAALKVVKTSATVARLSTDIAKAAISITTDLAFSVAGEAAKQGFKNVQKGEKYDGLSFGLTIGLSVLKGVGEKIAETAKKVISNARSAVGDAAKEASKALKAADDVGRVAQAARQSADDAAASLQGVRNLRDVAKQTRTAVQTNVNTATQAFDDANDAVKVARQAQKSVDDAGEALRAARKARAAAKGDLTNAQQAFTQASNAYKSARVAAQTAKKTADDTAAVAKTAEDAADDAASASKAAQQAADEAVEGANARSLTRARNAKEEAAKQAKTAEAKLKEAQDAVNPNPQAAAQPQAPQGAAAPKYDPKSDKVLKKLNDLGEALGKRFTGPKYQFIFYPKKFSTVKTGDLDVDASKAAKALDDLKVAQGARAGIRPESIAKRLGNLLPQDAAAKLSAVSFEKQFFKISLFKLGTYLVKQGLGQTVIKANAKGSWDPAKWLGAAAKPLKRAADPNAKTFEFDASEDLGANRLSVGEFATFNPEVAVAAISRTYGAEVDRSPAVFSRNFAPDPLADRSA